jgi:hypothetical protein
MADWTEFYWGADFCVAQDHLLRLVVPEIKLKMHKYSKCKITTNLIID